MGLISEVVKSYAPMLVALVVVVVLKTGLPPQRLNFVLILLVMSEIALMLKKTGRETDLLTEIKKNGWNQQEAEALEHLPRVLLEILTRFMMPKAGNLALTVLFVGLLVHNVLVYINGQVETIVVTDPQPK